MASTKPPQPVDIILEEGSCWIYDPEYLDPSYKVEGVLAIQFFHDKGLWALIGKIEKEEYSQTWESCGPEKKKATQLKSVK